MLGYQIMNLIKILFIYRLFDGILEIKQLMVIIFRIYKYMKLIVLITVFMIK
jgi:hypothetical protein